MVTEPVPVIAPEITDVVAGAALKSGSPVTVIALLIPAPPVKFSEDESFMATVFVPKALLAPTITVLPAVSVVPPV
jgi:hypothetical protein